jgi:hypothetical protein
MSAEHGDSQVHADDHETHGPPAPPEPKTPMWLTALGAVLFLAAGLWLAVSSSGSSPKDADASDAGTAAAQGGDAAAAGSGGGAEQNAQLQQMLQQMKK